MPLIMSDFAHLLSLHWAVAEFMVYMLLTTFMKIWLPTNGAPEGYPIENGKRLPIICPPNKEETLVVKYLLFSGIVRNLGKCMLSLLENTSLDMFGLFVLMYFSTVCLTDRKQKIKGLLQGPWVKIRFVEFNKA